MDAAGIPPTHRRFRTFLRLAKAREVQEPSVAAMAQILEGAKACQVGGDWLGYELALLRLAATVVTALEAHQKQVDQWALEPRERWYWEGLKPSQTFSIGASNSRAQAILQAESRLQPGDAYRVGRLGQAVRATLPAAEWVTGQMNRTARHEWGCPDLQWPKLDERQHAELQTMLDGLLTAFLEQEGALLEFTSLVDWEIRTVPDRRLPQSGGPGFVH